MFHNPTSNCDDHSFFTWGGIDVHKDEYPIIISTDSDFLPPKPPSYGGVIKSLCNSLMGIWMSIFLYSYDFTCSIIIIIIIISHGLYIYTRLPLEDLHMPPVIPGTM